MLARPPRGWGSLCTGGPTDTTPGTGHCSCAWAGPQLLVAPRAQLSPAHRSSLSTGPCSNATKAGREASATLPAAATGTPGPRAGSRPQQCQIHLHALKALTLMATGPPGPVLLQGLMLKACSLQRLRPLLASLLCTALGPHCSRDKSQERGSSPCPHSCCCQQPLGPVPHSADSCRGRPGCAGQGAGLLLLLLGAMGPTGPRAQPLPGQLPQNPTLPQHPQHSCLWLTPYTSPREFPIGTTKPRLPRGKSAPADVHSTFTKVGAGQV